jgi:hypothetical protein
MAEAAPAQETIYQMIFMINGLDWLTRTRRGN